MAACHHASLPRMLSLRYRTEAMAVAVDVAGRSLLARGLATVGTPGLRLTPSVLAQVAPVLRWEVSVEVVLNLPGIPSSTHLVCAGHSRIAILDEREPDVWVASDADADLRTAVGSLAEDGASEGRIVVGHRGKPPRSVSWTPSDHGQLPRHLDHLLPR